MKTHTGETIDEATLKSALTHIANEMRESARIGRTSDQYASHVTEEKKDELMQKELTLADEVEQGTVRGFWLWQRVNQFVTNECIAFLPK